MKIEIRLDRLLQYDTRIIFCCFQRESRFSFMTHLTLDQIEDLEINLTDIIKQLQDYRMKHES